MWLPPLAGGAVKQEPMDRVDYVQYHSIPDEFEGLYGNGDHEFDLLGKYKYLTVKTLHPRQIWLQAKLRWAQDHGYCAQSCCSWILRTEDYAMSTVELR